MFNQTLMALASAVAFSSVWSVQAASHAVTFDRKLTAPDGTQGDRFGNSVALSGDTALVGAFADDDNGPISGSAYLFDVTTGSLLQKLTAPDGERGDTLGYSVALSGNTALVGAAGDDDNGSRGGSAYLFDVTTGSLLQKLTAPDNEGGDQLGGSVALSGNTALVGAPDDRDNGEDSGSAYLFDVTTGSLLHKLIAPDGIADDHFGHSVALSGNTALVGAILSNNEESGGSAYLFDVTTGSLLQKFTPPDGTFGGRFGNSVALSGNTALVGDEFDSNDTGTVSGSAYLFDITTGSLLHKLTAPDGSQGDLFGGSVALSGDTALVGAIQDDDNGYRSGSAYLFDVTTGGLLQKLTAPDNTFGDLFGNSVALSGNTALVGALRDDDNGDSSGSAYLFTRASDPAPESVPEPASLLGLAAIGAVAVGGALKKKAAA